MENAKVDNYDEPASNIIQRKRWQMLGHVLRMEDNVLAKTLTIKAISDQQHMRKKRGRPPTTLTNTLVADLKRHNIKDITEAINIENDRKQWRDIFRLPEDVTMSRPSRSTRLGTS